jgi:hypothetical protein
MTSSARAIVGDVVGELPYRIALAGGWIDQPFCSRVNPAPPGSMVVISLEPTFRWMERSGLATGTRKVAARLWGAHIPAGDRSRLVEELYAEENKEQVEPSGTQDMIGLIYPGVSRLDYDAAHRGGVYPAHIESCTDVQVARWIERSIHVLPVAPRPPGYCPLGVKNLDPTWVQRLGQSGRDCYGALLARDVKALGASFNECMASWEVILPHTVRHPTLTVDLIALLRCYQERFPGAMYSGCGGGYLYVASEEPVPGAFTVDVRVA